MLDAVDFWMVVSFFMTVGFLSGSAGSAGVGRVDVDRGNRAHDSPSITSTYSANTALAMRIELVVVSSSMSQPTMYWIS